MLTAKLDVREAGSLICCHGSKHDRLFLGNNLQNRRPRFYQTCRHHVVETARNVLVWFIECEFCDLRGTKEPKYKS